MFYMLIEYFMLVFMVSVDSWKRKNQKRMNKCTRNFRWFYEHIRTELDAVQFLQEKNIIPARKICKKNHELQIIERDGCVNWRCSKSSCGQQSISVRRNTWLDGSRIPLMKIIMLIYSWASDYIQALITV